jgi:sulfatase modifying factor 1
MKSIRYSWRAGGEDFEIELVHVSGTHGDPYRFGEGTAVLEMEVPDFYIGSVPVTQALWTNVMGDGQNPALNVGMRLPVENISWDQLHGPGGFLERIQGSAAFVAVAEQLGGDVARFRLPTEAEWEYAARGGIHWKEGFRWSGSDTVETVAWHDRRHGDHTQPVALKAANSLGIFDMSGNVWEWCEDTYSENVSVIPRDGSAYTGPGPDRVLRGGCFHNWAVHCTVSKRYAIGSESHDGCIGLRLALAAF